MVCSLACVFFNALNSNINTADVLNLLLDISRNHSENLLALSQEERVERKAVLEQKAAEIRAQLHSPCKAQVLKYVTRGLAIASVCGNIGFIIAMRYGADHQTALQILKAAKATGDYRFLERDCYGEPYDYEKLINDWTAKSWNGVKAGILTALGTAALIGSTIYMNTKVEKQEALEQELEKITNQIAELDALEAQVAA